MTGRAQRVWCWRTVADPWRPKRIRVLPGGRTEATMRRVPHPLVHRVGEPVTEVCRGPNGNALLVFDDGTWTIAPWRAALRPPDSPALTGEENASEPGSGTRPANGSRHLAHAASPVRNLAPSRDRHTGTATRSKPGSTQPASATAPTHIPPGAVAPLDRRTQP